jgi:class 3 adenylate cyclase/tetratricopeptide (TPR) repeat protein
MKGLRRHIPELAIEWVLDEPGRLWQRIDGTLCFADISGFTALSEKLSRRGRIGGEELVETLSRVFGGMLDSARERDGMLLKFGGDALLFLFKGEDHASRAACTAVEMRQALRRAKEIATSVGPLKLSMSVGLHSGPIHFFLVGSTHRELVLAGPDASMAAATESAANAGEIGVSAGTAARLPAAAVRPREDGLLLLRWRKPPSPPAGASPERGVDEQTLRGLFPRALGAVLARGAPEPEHRVACIGFVRFSGTDALLEKEGADAVAAALDATIGTAQRILETEDLTLLAVDIDKDGGKLFLGSGVPQASEDDEGRMLRAMRRLADAGTPLPLQIGVNRGHVFAAEVGTPRRAAYSAMGDTTNTAARICAKAPPGGIYAHPSVLAHSLSKYATEPAGPFMFKGKKAPQVVYRVGEERARLAAGEETHTLPPVGRQAERKILAAAVADLASGRGQVVTLEGDAGLGKRRLLRATLEGGNDHWSVLRLRAESYGTSSPYRVFRDPLRRLLGIGSGDPEALRAQLEAGVERVDPALLPQLALVGEVVQIEVPPSPEVAAIEPRYRQDRIADAVVQLLAAERGGPRVIMMEDAQWADGASAHLLGRIASACAERPWLLLVTRRMEDGGYTPGAGQRLQLGPMPPAEMRELVNRATESAPLRPHELELVLRRAAGNPLFAEEIVRAAREAGSFEAVPDSLEATLAARVDALEPGARRALRYATVLGRSFSRRSLGGLLASEGLELDPGLLGRLEGFLEADGDDGLQFRGGLLRKTIYEGLAYRLRTRLHRSAGEFMEKSAADPATKADSLAIHFAAAGDHERAWRYSRIAAERAARAYANADAARLYRMALDAARRLADVERGELVKTWSERGDACRLAGLFDDALEAYRQAYRLADDDPVQRAELLRLRALARDRAGAFSQALRDLSAGVRLLAELESAEASRERARLASLAAMIRVGQERYQEAVKQGLKAAEAARVAGDQEAVAQALVAAGSAQMSMGEGGADWLEQALRIYEGLGDLSSEAMVRGNIGACALIEGRWDDALGWFEGACEAELRAGNHVGAACVEANRGEIFAKQGRIDEAEPILRDAIRVLRASGLDDTAAYVEIHLGRALVGRGAALRADELLERVGTELMKFGRKPSVLEAALVQSQARLQLGQATSALDVIDRAAAVAGGAIGWLEPQAAEARARTLMALGRYAESDAQISKGLSVAQKLGLKYEEGLLLDARSALARATGRPVDAGESSRRDEIMTALGVRMTPSAAHTKTQS